MQDPNEVFHVSDKSADSVSKCIDKKWEEIKVFGGANVVDVKNTEVGIRVTQRFGDTVHFIALVSARGTGSKTQVWSQKTIGAKKQFDDVLLCL